MPMSDAIPDASPRPARNLSGGTLSRAVRAADFGVRTAVIFVFPK